MADAPLDTRPNLTLPLEALLASVVRQTDELTAIDSRRIVVVGLAAHGTAVASVRSLRHQAASVVVGGQRRTWELGLRPGFFLEGDAPSRLATLIHELLHLDPRRDGELLEDNRHRHRSSTSLDKQARTVATAVVASVPSTALLCLAHHGEVRLRQWRRRPCETTARSRFTDRDVFDGIVHINTPPDRRGGWW